MKTVRKRKQQSSKWRAAIDRHLGDLLRGRSGYGYNIEPGAYEKLTANKLIVPLEENLVRRAGVLMEGPTE